MATFTECVHVLVDKASENYADSICLIDGTRCLTYFSFRESTNRLARYFLHLNIPFGSPAAIILLPSSSFVIAMFAIFKAGLAHVPLLPDTPAQRVEFVLENTKASLMITSESLRHIVPKTILNSQFPPTVVALDDPDIIKFISEMPTDNLTEPKVTLDNVAVILYTSGSTGTPKGVLVTHRNLTARASICELIPVPSGENCSLSASPMFVDSLREICQPLISGLSLETTTFKSNAYWLFNIKSKKIGRFTGTPTFLSLFLVTEFGIADFMSLCKVCMCTGEKLTMDVVNNFYSVFKEGNEHSLVNLYGTTEIWDATWYDTRPLKKATGENKPSNEANSSASLVTHVPIGKPLPYVRCRIVDENQKDVIKGKTGEMFVLGDGVAAGYLGLPEATAQKFLTVPAEEGGGLMYRTGDIVFENDNGEFVCVGRSDHQVKINGVRVELEEVEIHFREHPAIKDAMVGTTILGNSKKLIAQIELLDDEKLTAAEARLYLSGRLPYVSIPSVISFGKLPLTQSGKKDRQKLKLPSSVTEDFIPEFESELQKEVFFCMRNTLQIGGLLHQINLDSDFFQHGGNSLSALSLVMILNAKHKLRLHTPSIYRYPTPKELTDYIKGLIERGGGDQEEAAPNEVSTWAKLKNVRPELDDIPTTITLICFPYAGASEDAFHAWIGAVPASVKFYTVLLDDLLLETTSEEVSFANLVEFLARLLAPLVMAGPCVFFGHSWGSLLAHETVRVLRRHNIPLPAALVVSGFVAPPLYDVNATLLWFQMQMQEMLPVYERDLRILRTWQWVEEPALDIPIFAFHEDTDEYTLDQVKEWRKRTSHPFKLLLFYGGKMYIYSASAQVIEALESIFQEVSKHSKLNI